MDLAEIVRLLTSDETDRMEKTESGTNTDKFGEAICAFANDLPNHRLPGYLFVGVRADGTASGLPITDQLLQNLAAIRSDGNLLPPPSIVVQKVELPTGAAAVVEVQPSDLAPVRYKSKIYIRNGPRKGLAHEEDERVLSERRQARATTWDARTCPLATLDDLALDVFTLNYRTRAVDRAVVAENHRSMEHQLAASRLFSLRDGAGPTHAGVLVLGMDPLQFVPGAYVQYVQYDGPEKAAPVVSDRRITGDLLTVLKGVDELASSVARGRPHRAEGALVETQVYDYPPVALHELFVNALVHRNYESTAPVSISRFDDRIEVLSPGGLYAITPEEFPMVQGYRNPILAEAARVYGFANKYGRGVDIALAELRRNGSPDAEFDVRHNHVLVVIRSRP